MMITRFLQDTRWAFIIAKIAIIFQTIATCIIGTLLFCTVYGISYTQNLLSIALFGDMIFVCLHLTYRFLYTGKKVILKKSEKHVLFWHVLSSMLALCITSYIAFGGLENTYEWMCLALSSWIVSLFSGIVFFITKYIVSRDP